MTWVTLLISEVNGAEMCLDHKGGIAAIRPEMVVDALFAYLPAPFSILAHESRSDTVRLNTRAPGEESTESTQK